MTIEEFRKYAKFGTRKTRKRLKKELKLKYSGKEWNVGSFYTRARKYAFLTGFDNTFKTIEIEKGFGIEYIESGAFKNSTAEKIIIADGVNMYGDCVFDKTSISGWRTYLAPNEVFSGCKNLKQVKLPYVAANKYSISNKDFSLSVDAFFGCTSLEEIEIPPCVSVIGGGAFEGCTNLKKVELPITIKTIHRGAFWGCDSLKYLRVPEDCYMAFAVRDGCTVERYKVTEKEIEELLQQWNEDKFPERFPKKTKSDKKKEEEKKKAEAARKARNNFDFKIEEKEGERVLVKVGDKLPKDFVVPDTVTEIAARAFAENEILRTIVIPSSVKKIGNSAFAKCKRLREVTLPEGLTEIARSTFADCPQLMKVNYPSTLLKICERAFYQCPKLQSPKLPWKLKRIEEYAFYPLSVQKLHIPYDCKCSPRASDAKIVVGYEEIPLERYVEQQKVDKRYREEQREIDRINLARLAEQKRNAAQEPQKNATSANSSGQSDAPFAFIDMWDEPQAFKDFMRQGYIYMQDESYWGAIDQFQKATKVRGVSEVNKQYAQYKLDEATVAKDKQKKEEDERKYKEAVEERIREMKRREAEEKAAAERAKKEAEERAKREKEAASRPATKSSTSSKSSSQGKGSSVDTSSVDPSLTIEECTQRANDCYYKKDYVGCFKYRLRAAELGDAGSMHTVGTRYLEGEVCPLDDEVAFAWFQRSAEHGFKGGIAAMAMCYENGLGVPRDLEMALKLYRQFSDGEETWNTWKVKELMKEEKLLGEVQSYRGLPRYKDKFVDRRYNIGIINLLNILNGEGGKIRYIFQGVEECDIKGYYAAIIKIKFRGTSSEFENYFGHAHDRRRAVDKSYESEWRESGLTDVVGSYDYMTGLRQKSYKQDIARAEDAAYSEAQREMIKSARIHLDSTKNGYHIIGLVNNVPRRIGKYILTLW